MTGASMGGASAPAAPLPPSLLHPLLKKGEGGLGPLGGASRPACTSVAPPPSLPPRFFVVAIATPLAPQAPSVTLTPRWRSPDEAPGRPRPRPRARRWCVWRFPLHHPRWGGGDPRSAETPAQCGLQGVIRIGCNGCCSCWDLSLQWLAQMLPACAGGRPFAGQ